MKKLNGQLLESNYDFPDDLQVSSYKEMPEKVLQFGEGNFLRGFVNWMFDKLNTNDLFNGKVVIVQPIEHGLVDKLNEQDGLYTLLLRGIQEGQVVETKQIITSVSRGINPYENFQEYLDCAQNPHLRVIVSNTTEAGISYNPEDKFDDTPPASYPGKLTVLLYKRFEYFKGNPEKGLIIIPCELIDRNGDKLQAIVKRLAEEWNLGTEFIYWLENACHFLNTLVDRIVTGYPREEAGSLAKELGYEDSLLDTAEVFHLWVIEGDKKLAKELPFTDAGHNVIWTSDMTPYRTRKVRILNGAHTMTCPAAYLYGKETVKDFMDDEVLSKYMNKGLFEEIIPTLDLPKSELDSFAAAVCERFANPFIKHYLLSITLNSTSKFKTRVLPSIEEYIKRKGQLPQVLTFSLAALIAFYKGTEIRDHALIGDRDGEEYKIMDEMPILELFKSLWTEYDGSVQGSLSLVRAVLSREDFWGSDLNKLEGFCEAVANYLHNILTKGMQAAVKQLV